MFIRHNSLFSDSPDYSYIINKAMTLNPPWTQYIYNEFLNSGSKYFTTTLQVSNRCSEVYQLNVKLQKQPVRGDLRKRSSENMQQIYRRTPMLKCKLHFRMSVLLQICSIFSEHLFVRTPLDGCFWSFCFPNNQNKKIIGWEPLNKPFYTKCGQSTWLDVKFLKKQ